MPCTANSTSLTHGKQFNITEGIKEKDRSLMNKILSQISLLKDNTYQLRRSMWNDVNEDWPFYTEEEKRMLKRYVIIFIIIIYKFFITVPL